MMIFNVYLHGTPQLILTGRCHNQKPRLIPEWYVIFPEMRDDGLRGTVVSQDDEDHETEVSEVGRSTAEMFCPSSQSISRPHFSSKGRTLQSKYNLYNNGHGIEQNIWGYGGSSLHVGIFAGNR